MTKIVQKTIETCVRENKAKVQQRLEEDADLPCPLQEEIISYDHLDAADDLDKLVSCKEKCGVYQRVMRLTSLQKTQTINPTT